MNRSILPVMLLWHLTLMSGSVLSAERRMHASDANPPTPATYRQLADEIDKHWQSEVLGAWFPRCIDKEHGGFLPNFLEDWSPGTANDKTIVFQARTTWVCAQVAIRGPQRKAEFLAHAKHGFDFLATTMWDHEQGGFYWGLDSSGKRTDRYGGEKHAYGISFGIYAVAAVYEATGDPRALDLAKQTFAWLDRNAHDPQHGGYYEALSRDGKPLLTPPNAQRSVDSIGTRFGLKSMNTHIHLLESLTALHHVWPDPAVKARLEELFLLVRDKIAAKPGFLNLYFQPDWTIASNDDSFGHDIETAYLLLEAAGELGKADDEKTLTVARSLVDHALRCGWDEKLGGFYDLGKADAPAHGLDKIWWTQAEGLNTLLLMHERFGHQTPKYFQAFLKQWDFIWNYQADPAHGEWYEVVAADGRAKPGQAKGTVWKAAYHNGRALMNVTERLRRLAAGSDSQRP